jgi:hypothetical protein
MNGYANAAVSAAARCRSNPALNVGDAWDDAVASEFTSLESQKKGCPKGTFLGLCEEGLVIGIAPGNYTSSKLNKVYALAAVTLLRKNPTFAGEPRALWRRISAKNPNCQMEVVIALWNSGSIER